MGDDGSWVQLEEEEMLVAVEEAVTRKYVTDGSAVEVFLSPRETMAMVQMNVRTGSRVSRHW